MIPLAYLREYPDEVTERLKIKNFDAGELIKNILTIDKERRTIQVLLDDRQASMNTLSRSIGELMKAGKKEEANEARAQTGQLKEEIQQLNQQFDTIGIELDNNLVLLPNIPHSSVPAGRSAEDNELIRSGGQLSSLPENALPHWDLAKRFDIIDFELGNKITGSGFPVYKGKGAQLQRALISFFLDENCRAGYTEYLPPLMVNEDSAFATGQLPDKEGQMYHMQEDNFYLIPTAEVPVTNIFRDVILEEKALPVKCTAYTPCFRREAGSYGKDVRGLNRLHQFDKVEIVQVQHPDRSYQTLEEMVAHVEGLLNKLALPYRIVKLCGGDMSFASALTYDFEVYAGAQQRWLEVSSVSNFAVFQANRLKLRYRDEATKKPLLAHTLNGSSLALPRIVAALLENNQGVNGITLPSILHRYTGFDSIGG